MSTQAERVVAHLAAKAKYATLCKSANGAPHKKFIETDISDQQAQINALRSDFNALREQVIALAGQLLEAQGNMAEDRSAAMAGLVVKSPQAQAGGDGQEWWEWTQQHVEACLSAEIEELSAVTAQAIGNLAERTRSEFDEQAAAAKREIELIRRELNVMKNEVAVERKLDDLQADVERATKSIPRVPAIVQRFRTEAIVAKANIEHDLGELRAEFKQARLLLSSLQAKQAQAAKAASGGPVELEWESLTERGRLIFPSGIHPDAARAMKNFAQKAINGRLIEH